MAGRGSVITEENAYGYCDVFITNAGSEEPYELGSQLGRNNTTGALCQGDVVLVSWDEAIEEISIDALGERGEGNVSTDGRSILVIEEGDTELTGVISIDLSSEFGTNEGFGNQTVTFANIDGKAAYLAAA